MFAFTQCTDRLLQLVDESCGKGFSELTSQWPITVRCWDMAHMIFHATDWWHLGAQLGYGRSVAMVGTVSRNDAGSAGGGVRHAQCDIIGLAAGTCHDGGRQAAMKSRRQALNVIENALVQITGVCVEGGRLLMDRVDHPWVAVTDMRHIVVAVEVPFALGIVKPDIFPANNVHRIVIEQRCVLAEETIAPSCQGCG